jgi:hypothetical protein
VWTQFPFSADRRNAAGQGYNLTVERRNLVRKRHDYSRGKRWRIKSMSNKHGRNIFGSRTKRGNDFGGLCILMISIILNRNLHANGVMLWTDLFELVFLISRFINVYMKIFGNFGTKI